MGIFKNLKNKSSNNFYISIKNKKLYYISFFVNLCKT